MGIFSVLFWGDVRYGFIVCGGREQSKTDGATGTYEANVLLRFKE
jgi:hypothetical protein